MTIEVSNMLQIFLIAAVASTVLSSLMCLSVPKQKKVEVEI